MIKSAHVYMCAWPGRTVLGGIACFMLQILYLWEEKVVSRGCALALALARCLHRAYLCLPRSLNCLLLGRYSSCLAEMASSQKASNKD